MLSQIVESFHRSLDRVEAYFPKARRRPARAEAAARLREYLPDVPVQLEVFLSICDGMDAGLKDGVVGRIHGFEEILLAWPVCGKASLPAVLLPLVPKLLPLVPMRGDGCGDYDCLVVGSGIANGSVVFWDHEEFDDPAYLLAGSLASYLEFWADYIVTVYEPDGTNNPEFVPPRVSEYPWLGKARRTHPWPFDRAWIAKHDPGAAALISDPAVTRWMKAR